MKSFIKAVFILMTLVSAPFSQAYSHVAGVMDWDGKETVTFTGRFDEAAADRIEKMHKMFGFKKLVLNSQGGVMVAGTQAGRYIRANDIRVSVKGQCLSSCALAAIGDKQFKGELKFHAPFLTKEQLAKIPQAEADVIVYNSKVLMWDHLIRMGHNNIPITEDWYTVVII